jgi:antitoxin component of RelBE/YafQ-DinJ toxin-antitoxin module
MKTTRINIRTTQEIKDELQQRAKELGLSLSSYIILMTAIGAKSVDDVKPKKSK